MRSDETLSFSQFRSTYFQRYRIEVEGKYGFETRESNIEELLFEAGLRSGM